MRINELIGELEKRTGGTYPIEGGICAISIDDMPVTIQEINEIGVISTYAEIGEPPPQGLEKLYEAMLSANHLFQGTNGSTISFDAESRHFFLCRVDQTSMMDGAGFCAMLEQFVNTLAVWRKMLADYRPVAETVVDEPDGLSGSAGLSGFMQV